jgi:hypothetical protein
MGTTLVQLREIGKFPPPPRSILYTVQEKNALRGDDVTQSVETTWRSQWRRRDTASGDDVTQSVTRSDFHEIRYRNYWKNFSHGKVSVMKAAQLMHYVLCGANYAFFTSTFRISPQISVKLETREMDITRGGEGGHTVAQLVEALHHKPEGRGFDSRWCHNPFGCTMALGSTQPLTEISTGNISWGVKAAGA